jgi:hypothetical protein
LTLDGSDVASAVPAPRLAGRCTAAASAVHDAQQWCDISAATSSRTIMLPIATSGCIDPRNSGIALLNSRHEH